MGNTLHLVELPARMSGPRHGGARMERRHEVYINGKLYESFVEGSEHAFRWSTGGYYDRALLKFVQKLEDVLDCKVVRARSKQNEG